jgi:capsular exopolysaccharide synthesis family protein
MFHETSETDVLFRPTVPPGWSERGLDALAERLRGKVILEAGLPPVVAEQYRHLVARLHHASERSNAKILMVSSAMPGEGKTLTATNIALTLSESYKRRVLVIDADLRRPSMHEIFRVPNTCGVNELLLGMATPPAFEISPRLALIPAGRPNPDPLSGLTSPRFEALVQAAAREYDWVVIDTPPVGLLTDANLIVRLADAVVMVVAAGRVAYRELQRAADALGRDRIIGVVLNRVAEQPFSAEYGYDGYYGAKPSGADR